ncbi:MAG: cell division protein FtsL [Bacillota bacterium]
MLVAKQPIYQPQPQLPARRPQKRQRQRQRPSLLTSAEKATLLLVIVALGVTSLGLVWRFAQVNDLEYRVDRLAAQIARLEEDNSALIIQINSLTSPAEVERRAGRELGMRWPDQEQIISVLPGN